MLSLLWGHLQCVGGCRQVLFSQALVYFPFIFQGFPLKFSTRLLSWPLSVSSCCVPTRGSPLGAEGRGVPACPAPGLAETPSLPSPLPAAPRARSWALFFGLLGDNLITPRLLSST